MHSIQAPDRQLAEPCLNLAGLAFRQAFALYPSSAEALYRYVSVLVDQKRFQDARRLTAVAQILDPAASSYRQLLEALNKLEANESKGK